MEKLEVVDEAWDVKKILLFVVFAGILAFGIKTFVLDKKVSTKSMVDLPQVQGTSTKGDSSENFSPKQEIQKGVEEKLSELKKEVNNLNIVEVATSTPAVQKVLNDIKNLQQVPKNQCLNICNNLCIR